MKKGILFIQLGTPNSPKVSDVKKYLKEFLMDPYVIDLPWPLRFFLVYIIIAPFRSKNSSHAYKQIWNQRGSPLKYITVDFIEKMKSKLANHYEVEWAMRYQQPTIIDALSRLKEKNVEELLLIPLYPQNADSTTTSSLVKCNEIIKNLNWKVFITPWTYFFDKNFFIKPQAQILNNYNLKSYDHIYFSYHGLPVSHIEKISNHCKSCAKKPTCDIQQDQFSDQMIKAKCYRFQCFETTRLICLDIKIDFSKVTTCFQSRLGPAEWLTPYTVDSVWKGAKILNQKKILIICPSFVTDCLETLEEIQGEVKEQFINAGGEHVDVAPCLNDNDLWISELSKQLILDATV